jgi:CRISPR-associated endonuclease/helicase Cas3
VVAATTSDCARGIAHVADDGRLHFLDDHLVGTAALARDFAGAFGAGEWGDLGGWAHDLGKYSRAFRRRIAGAMPSEAHLEGAGEPADHSTAGAVLMAEIKATPLAFVIAGHHAGLADQAALRDRLVRKRDHLQLAFEGGAPAAYREAKVPAMPGWVARHEDGARRRRDTELWTRFLFSAVCDADFLDTERFFDDGRSAQRGTSVAPVELLRRLEAFLDRKQAGARKSTVNAVRAEVRAAAAVAAAGPQGAFGLAVPTGGGKTLASLEFALRHAVAHGLSRVIVAIPYTSILEQTVGVYREALAPTGAPVAEEGVVIEHHSSVDPTHESPRGRLACENWDAPVVVTTNVQLFESLFARRPSRCRKLHRVARSVVVLDEAQTLPPHLLTPTLEVLDTLVDALGVSVVVCTATQPVLDRVSLGLPSGLPALRPIVPAALRAYERLRRVRVTWPETDAVTTYEELASRVAERADALAIVHRRADARRLTELVDAELGTQGTIHLSAMMCGAHRAAVLAEIRRARSEGEPLHVVATQLVEAGVDLDFPVVFRAMAGLDALAQAAGRCNREGLLDDLGELVVYFAETAPPQGILRTAHDQAVSLLRERGTIDLFAPETFETYFRRLYRLVATNAKRSAEIQAAREGHQFEQVATLFRMIDEDLLPVVVPYGEAAALLARLAAAGPSRSTLRALQRYVVQMRAPLVAAWQRDGVVREVTSGLFALERAFAGAYDPRLGLLAEDVGTIAVGDLVVD